MPNEITLIIGRKRIKAIRSRKELRAIVENEIDKLLKSSKAFSEATDEIAQKSGTKGQMRTGVQQHLQTHRV